MGEEREFGHRVPFMPICTAASGLRGAVCRHEVLAKPLGLWNHLDIDFADEEEKIVPGSNTKNAHKVLLVLPQTLLTNCLFAFRDPSKRAVKAFLPHFEVHSAYKTCTLLPDIAFLCLCRCGSPAYFSG